MKLYSAEDESTSKSQLLPHKHDIITLLGVGGHWITTERNLQVKILCQQTSLSHNSYMNVPELLSCLNGSPLVNNINFYLRKLSYPENGKHSALVFFVLFYSVTILGLSSLT